MKSITVKSKRPSRLVRCDRKTSGTNSGEPAPVNRWALDSQKNVGEHWLDGRKIKWVELTLEHGYPKERLTRLA